MDKATEFERFIETLEAMECPYEADADSIEIMGIAFWFDGEGKFVKVEDYIIQEEEHRGAGYV